MTHDVPGLHGAPAGIDRAAVTAWFAERVEVVGDLDFSLIAGGHSNLTFTVSDQGGHRWVLRRPPLGHVLATAHDMGREHRIISALADTPIPVAPTIGYCDDDTVNGAPFYVMAFVDGLVVRDEAAAATLSAAQRATASASLIDVLAAIHATDVDAVGLGDLGRRDGYLERQLKRWYQQYAGSKEMTDRVDFRAIDDVHDHLAARVPPQQGTTIVHGDYRLDNCMLGADASVVAVLDWELCTLGDPLADLGLLWVYWTDPGSAAVLPQASPTSLEGFMRRDEILARYEAASGRDLSGIDYYIAFGYWKLACIIAGVYARYAAGVMGEVDDRQVAAFATMVSTLADMASAAAEKVA